MQRWTVATLAGCVSHRSSLRKRALKGTIPALVKSMLGSLAGTSDDEGSTTCPRPAK